MAYSEYSLENMQKELGLSTAEADNKSNDLNLATVVESDLTAYRKALPASAPEDKTPKGHPVYAFEHMASERFTLSQYCQKTGVARSTAREDFNILEKLGLVTIHRATGGKPNEIESAVPENLKQPALQVLQTYRTRSNIPLIKAQIENILLRESFVLNFIKFLEIFKKHDFQGFASVETIMKPSFEDVARETMDYLKTINIL